MKKVYQRTAIAVLATALLVALGVCAYFYMSVSVQREYATTSVKIGKNYRAVFNDKNATQLKAANAMGITPLKDGKLIPSLIEEGKLLKLHSCRYYWCTAKPPYLTPEAADLLAEIGRRYKEKLGYTFKTPKVTSMFRTKEDVTDLRKRNKNAVENSCHLYGTTFDIGYARMSSKERNAMAQVLAELRNAGYCYAIYERGRQKCFHITVRK